MRFAFEFQNLFGVAYKQGNVLFSSDGNRLISPVGNRVCIFDLAASTTRTLECQNGKNIVAMALSPDDRLLITVDESGRSLLINMHRGVVLSRMNFKGDVKAIKFSHNGARFAVAIGRKLQVWKTPSHQLEFAPFRLLMSYTLGHADITCISWSPDDRYIISGGEDFVGRLCYVGVRRKPLPKEPAQEEEVGEEDSDRILFEEEEQEQVDEARVHITRAGEVVKRVVLSGHRDFVVGCFFGNSSTEVRVFLDLSVVD